MNELLMLQAALFQLKGAVEAIDDTFLQTQMRLAVNVLGGAVAAAHEGLNPARINDIEFAMNDVVSTASELDTQTSELVSPFVTMLQGDLVSLKALAALDPALVAAVQGFQQKLRERRTAIERQTYAENGGEPLPHPPEKLWGEAVPLKEKLVANGFEVPALETLLKDPSSLRFHSITAIIDELDVVIAGT